MRGHRYALAGILAGAALLRFATLDTQSFWLDEATTGEIVDGSLDQLLDRIPETEATPPLYYVLAWAWAKLLGEGDFVLRSLSALLGTAAVGVAYLIGRELVSRRVGLVLALLAAVNPFLVWYSQEARSYSLVLLLGALSFLFFLRVLGGAGGRAVLWWTLASAAALTAHYYAALLVVPEAVWLLARARARRPVAAGTAALALVGAALAPLAAAQADGRVSFIATEGSLPYRLARLPKQFLSGFDAPAEVVLASAMALLVAFGLVLLVHRGDAEERRAATLAGGLALATVGAAALAALAGADYVNSRNLIAAWLPAAAAVSAGLGARRAGRAGAAAVAALVAGSLVVVIATATEPSYQRDDWRDAVEALGPSREPRIVAVAPASGFAPFRRYASGARSLPARGALVREIDILALPRRESSERSAGVPPRGRPPEIRLVPGFRPVEVRHAETYTLVRYRSARARGVNRATGRVGLDRRPPEMVLLPPSG